jgi:hypothetical protein
METKAEGERGEGVGASPMRPRDERARHGGESGPSGVPWWTAADLEPLPEEELGVSAHG